MSITTLELRSLITPEGELRLTLEKVPLPAPEPDEVVVWADAAPINPSTWASCSALPISTRNTSGPV